MLSGDKVIRIFCLVDDLLKGIGHCEDVRCRVSDIEVITTAIVAVLYLGGHQDNARSFMQMNGNVSSDVGQKQIQQVFAQIRAIVVQYVFSADNI